MTKNLLVLCGKKAYPLIMERGLVPESVSVVAGASGGPKWLALDGLDRAIFFNWMKGHKQTIKLIGSSIGVWRFSAIAQKDPENAYDKFQDAYIHQSYSKKPDAQEITGEAIRVMNEYLTEDGAKGILANPKKRLNILAVRCRWPLSKEGRHLLLFGMVSSGILNLISRRSLRLFFDRVLFYDPRDIPPISDGDDIFPTQKIPLTEKNIRDAILASGSIPLVMRGVRDISGAPQGYYRDGGIVDYHIDIPFGPVEKNGIVLFPHYLDRIIPGWFDKHLPWRRPNSENIENVVLLCPSREFVEKLPYGKIPDRSDFPRFKGDDKARIAYWKKVVSEAKRLGDEFFEITGGGKIGDRIRLL